MASSPPPLVYSYQQFSEAKRFFFRVWCEFARERGAPPPEDLSGACKYASLFMRELFGGEIEGHYAHQYNRIDGRLVDLSHDARDVGRMHNPYLHEPEYFNIPEYQRSRAACMPRIDTWVRLFLQEHDEAAARTTGLPRS